MKLDLTCPNCASCLTTKEDIDFISILGSIEMCSECKHKFEVLKKHLQKALTPEGRQKAIAMKAKIKAMAGKEMPINPKEAEKPKLAEKPKRTAKPKKPVETKRMKPCPMCAEDILEQAIKCKHCGEMFNQREEELEEVIEEEKKGMSNENWAVLIMLPFILYFCVFNGDKSDSKKASATLAYVLCEDIIRQKLKSPSTADFGGYNDSKVTSTNQTVTIKSYVDAQNSFGGTIRSKWSCTATHNGGDPYQNSSWDISSYIIN